MGAHPFGEYAEKYMASVRGVYAEETWKTRERRYRRIEARMIELKKNRKISTLSPKGMTPEDVREYILCARESLAPSDMVQEVNALKQLLQYVGNDAVDVCLRNYPGLKPVVKGVRRKPSMSDETYDRILRRAQGLDPTDYALVRSYAFVLLCINCGCRNKEIRFAEARDLDVDAWTLDIVHVKGESTYGCPRKVPVPPEIRGTVVNWLLLRRKWLMDNSCDSRALFPSKTSPDGFLSSNALRKMKEKVEEDLGIDFDLRECRRTFGQRYLDAGLDIESTSVLMGHSTTRTTEQFYSRRRNDKAIDRAMETWSRDGGQRSNPPFGASGY